LLGGVAVETKQVIVIRGVVERNIVDAPSGSDGRTAAHRFYRVGETIFDLSIDEAARLVKSGVVKVVS
jgi:hypothetical protein